jgi:hypothetical protein
VFIWYASAELPCEPGLQCWLQSLSVPLPNTTLTQDEATLTINSITCNNITAPLLSSSAPSLLTIQIKTMNIGMNCNGNWQLTSPNGTESGAVGVVVSGASILMSMSVASNGTFINPEDPTCDVQLTDISLEFYNQPESILDKFKDVQSNITAQIIASSSTQILNATSAELNDIFSGANGWVSRTIENAIYNPSFPSGGPPGFRIFYLSIS